MATNYKKEKEIARIMTGLKCSRAEAEQIWLDDNSDEMTEEQAELTAKAELNGTDKVRGESDKERKKSSKERKVDEIKKSLLEEFKSVLEDISAENIEVFTETEMDFTHENKRYTLKLIGHRPNWERPKKEKKAE